MNKQGFTLMEVLIVVAVLGIVIGILWSFVGAPELNHEVAEKAAREWVAKLYPKAKEVNIACQSLDTDQDSYVSCTAVVDGERIGLECAAYLEAAMGNSCRLPKMLVR